MKSLKKFVTLEQSSLEIAEKLEQLRLIENDIPVHVVVTAHKNVSVDRPEDLKKVLEILA
jgi:3-deoxy-manno-octulosonate cytidylyltransferase (CMP-KDO synthetase)